MNLLFPVSVTAATIVALTCLVAQAASPPNGARSTRSASPCSRTLLALAMLEHWFLVLPLPDAALWHWGLRSRAARHAARRGVERRRAAWPTGAGFARRLHRAPERGSLGRVGRRP